MTLFDFFLPTLTPSLTDCCIPGYSLVLSACVMSALGIVLTKLTSAQVEKLIILFYLGIAITVCGFIGLLSLGRPSNPPLRERFIE